MKLLFFTLSLFLQYIPQSENDTLFVRSISAADSSSVVLTMDDVLKVAMSENVSVMVADMEIKRKEYAKKGTYAALYPQIDANGSFQRTIEKQTFYMEDMAVKVGLFNNFAVGATASMPIVNAQLWQSLKISADDVELAVEKARSSRLDMVTEVKTAFYAVLLAKETARVYEQVYDNAKRNLEVTQMRFNAQRASEMELLRAKTSVANAIPDVYNSRNLIDLSLWQLKAVMGVDLDFNMDIAGSLHDYAGELFLTPQTADEIDLSRNSSLRQLQLQTEELAKNIKLNKMAYVPTLALAFAYNYSVMNDTFNFKQYTWTPYSYVGLSLSIPIFSGGKRFTNVRQSQVQYEQMRLQQTQTERQLRIAVKSDLSTMETYMNSYYAAQSAVASARKSLDVSEKSYEVGRITLVELNASVLAYAQAELNQWQAVYNFLTSKADLEKQLGQDYIFD